MTVRLDLTIRQGETWSEVVTLNDSAGSPRDLTGYSARMAIRTVFNGPLEAYLSTVVADRQGGSIALGGALGTVTLSMTAAESTDLGGEISYWLRGMEPVERTTRMVYDLELVDGSGNVTRELVGFVYIERGVTQ